MMLMTQAPPQVDDEALAVSMPVRKTRCNVAGTGMLSRGPQANPRRIRLTTPGNPVHR